MKLDKLFTDLFDAPSFSRDEIDTFATDHLAKLNNNNPSAIYTAVIAATTTKLQAFKDNLVGASGSLGVQMGSTNTKNVAKEALLAFVSRKAKALSDIFYNNKPAYIEFYPRGLDEYNHAGLEELATLAGRYKTATAKYVVPLGAGFKTEADVLMDAYINSRAVQVGKKGTANDGNITVNAVRKALTIQLTVNVHTIAINNVDNLTAITTYFNESLLYNEVATIKVAVVVPTL